MSEWIRIKELRSIFTVVNDKRKQLKTSGYYTTGKYPIIDQSSDFICGYSDRDDVLFSSPLPIIVFGDHTRWVKYVDFPFIAGADGTQILKASDWIDSKFLFYVVQKASQNIGNFGYDRHLKHLKRYPTSVPANLSEQRKIADILSTVDEVIEKTEATIEKYQAIKAGMMQDLFTRGIDAQTGKLRPTIEEAPELYKESELGWIPREWEIATLSEVCGMRSGDGITSKSIDEYGSYPVYGGNGLRGYTANYTHEGSYVLIGRQGALCGNVKRVDGIFYASEHAVVVSVNSDTNVDWMSYILESMNLNTYSEASAQPGLAVGKILCLRIRVPQLTEQSMIASVIQSLNTKIEAETALYSEYNKIKQGLMADLLTGTVKTV